MMMQGILRLIIIFGLLSGCSAYSSKFKCEEAKGLGCTMLRDVDKQIDSGQIEEVYKTKKECKKNKCGSN